MGTTDPLARMLRKALSKRIHFGLFVLFLFRPNFHPAYQRLIVGAQTLRASLRTLLFSTTTTLWRCFNIIVFDA
jgi:hypothetical protein